MNQPPVPEFTEITDAAHLAAELDHGLVVMKIWSKTCGPCLNYTLRFNNLAGKYEGVNFVSCEMSKKLFPPMAVPSTLLIVNGIIVDKFVGAGVSDAVETALDAEIATYKM